MSFSRAALKSTCQCMLLNDTNARYCSQKIMNTQQPKERQLEEQLKEIG